METATKEGAKAARGELTGAANMLDTLIPDKDQRDEVKRHLLRVDGFLERAEARLPSQAAVTADGDRRAAKAKAATKGKGK